MLEMTRRTLIKGIGAALCMGSTPAFIPGLINGDAKIVTVKNNTNANVFLHSAKFNYHFPKKGKLSVVSVDLLHEDFDRFIAKGILSV